MVSPFWSCTGLIPCFFYFLVLLSLHSVSVSFFPPSLLTRIHPNSLMFLMMPASSCFLILLRPPCLFNLFFGSCFLFCPYQLIFCALFLTLYSLKYSCSKELTTFPFLWRTVDHTSLPLFSLPFLWHFVWHFLFLSEDHELNLDSYYLFATDCSHFPSYYPTCPWHSIYLSFSHKYPLFTTFCLTKQHLCIEPPFLFIRIFHVGVYWYLIKNSAPMLHYHAWSWSPVLFLLKTFYSISPSH